MQNPIFEQISLTGNIFLYKLSRKKKFFTQIETIYLTTSRNRIKNRAFAFLALNYDHQYRVIYSALDSTNRDVQDRAFFLIMTVDPLRLEPYLEKWKADKTFRDRMINWINLMNSNISFRAEGE